MRDHSLKKGTDLFFAVAKNRSVPFFTGVAKVMI